MTREYVSSISHIQSNANKFDAELVLAHPALNDTVELARRHNDLGVPLAAAESLYRGIRILDTQQREMSNDDAVEALGANNARDVRKLRAKRDSYLENAVARLSGWCALAQTREDDDGAWEIYRIVNGVDGEFTSRDLINRIAHLTASQVLRSIDRALDAGLLVEVRRETYRWTGRHHKASVGETISERAARARRSNCLLGSAVEGGAPVAAERWVVKLTGPQLEELASRLANASKLNPMDKLLSDRETQHLDDTCGVLVTLGPAGGASETVFGTAQRHVDSYAANRGVYIMPTRAGLTEEAIERFFADDWIEGVAEVEEVIGRIAQPTKKRNLSKFAITVIGGRARSGEAFPAPPSAEPRVVSLPEWVDLATMMLLALLFSGFLLGTGALERQAAADVVESAEHLIAVSKGTPVTVRQDENRVAVSKGGLRPKVDHEPEELLAFLSHDSIIGVSKG